MKITNTGKKIVHIGTTALMPGAEIVVADKVAQTPAIQVLAKHGILTLTASNEKPSAPKAPKAPADNSKGSTPAPATADPKAGAAAPDAGKPGAAK